MKATSPLVVGNRVLVYVGPRLAEKMTKNKAHLVYADGSTPVVKPNPAFKD